ncbi:DinB family protein [Flavihumibacter sp. R14]|nr:DinB family protein [Flavihumibacter soli]
MDIIALLKKEMEREAVTTRKMLALVRPEDFDYKPHPKSMVMKYLATHIAELPGWTKMAVDTAELDFAAMDYTPAVVESNADLLALYEKSLSEGLDALDRATEDGLLPDWTLRKGETIYSVTSKYEVIRMSFCQTVHHRAQLGVYLRLLNIPIPGSYGPSADDANFQ